MKTRTIKTDAGKLDLILVAKDQLRGIAHYWPMELIGTSDELISFGLVFQHGDQEVDGIKMQPADIPVEEAMTITQVHRVLVATALPYYLEKQHRGLMLPCPYYKEKAAGMAEAGISFFVGPDPTSESTSGEPADSMYDNRLGNGATPMVSDMTGAIARASRECGLPLMTVIGMEIRPRLAIGSLAMDFAIEGSRVFVVKVPLHEDEPIWEYVVRAGFSSLHYAPMKPMAFRESPPEDIPRF